MKTAGYCIPRGVDGAAPQMYRMAPQSILLVCDCITLHVIAGDVMVWETPDQALPSAFNAETFAANFETIEQ